MKIKRFLKLPFSNQKVLNSAPSEQFLEDDFTRKTFTFVANLGTQLFEVVRTNSESCEDGFNAIVQRFPHTPRMNPPAFILSFKGSKNKLLHRFCGTLIER